MPRVQRSGLVHGPFLKRTRSTPSIPRTPSTAR